LAETASLELACDTCGSRWPLQPLLFGCPACAEAGCTSSLHVRYPASRIIAETTRAVSHTSQWDFAPLLPVPEPTVRTTLGEGWTPLVQAERLAAEADARVLVKLETCNPTGAFKDRLNAVSVSAARQFGYQRVLCTTTGNHGVSLAAYAAVARLDCLVVCQPDVEPIAVQQMRLHGARVAVIGGPPAGVRSYLARLVRDEGYWPSVRNHPRPYANPFGLEGYKTIAYEIWLQLECRIPDAVFVPTGGGDSLAGIARGFRDLIDLSLADATPLLVACQPAAAAPLVRAKNAGLTSVAPVSVGTSAAISVLEESTGDHALRALADTGVAIGVSEAQITQAGRLLGADGLCVEPASAVGAAGLLALAAQGRIETGSTCVCIATATGLRWPTTFRGIDSAPEIVSQPSGRPM